MGEIMPKPLRYFALAALVGMFSFPASAAIINLTASIDGGQEVPPTGSPATGTGSMVYNDVSNLLSWEITYTADTMIGTPTVSHFHGPAPVGSNAGVQVDIVANSGGSIASPMIGSENITEAQELDLLAGLWYINIHSTRFPGGEIRGQVNVVPVPAAVWLFGSGLIGLLGIARRKQR
jgi:hypothetical protein